MYSLWVLLAFCTTPLERAAITFLPLAKPLELHELEKLLIRMAISAGLGLGTLLACIPVLCPDILTHVRCLAKV